MKKNKISTLAKAGLAIGAISSLGMLDANASQVRGVSALGAASNLRVELVQKNINPAQNAPVYLSSHDKEGEGKCGEGKCGEGKCGDNKDKDGTEGNCGEGHDEGKE